MGEPALWTADELVAASGGKIIGKVTKPLNGVSIDTRTIVSGDIFVAIKGGTHDAHEFVPQGPGCGCRPRHRLARFGRDDG